MDLDHNIEIWKIMIQRAANHQTNQNDESKFFQTPYFETMFSLCSRPLQRQHSSVLFSPKSFWLKKAEKIDL